MPSAASLQPLGSWPVSTNCWHLTAIKHLDELKPPTSSWRATCLRVSVLTRSPSTAVHTRGLAGGLVCWPETPSTLRSCLTSPDGARADSGRPQEPTLNWIEISLHVPHATNILACAPRLKRATATSLQPPGLPGESATPVASGRIAAGTGLLYFGYVFDVLPKFYALGSSQF